jgi:uncharacterized protein (DUF427 family)
MIRATLPSDADTPSGGFPLEAPMSSKPIRIPGPDHPIRIELNLGRVIVRLGDTVVADSRRALTLREANYPPVQYVPREDIKMALLEPSTHHSYCPYKGDASYLSVKSGGAALANAIWSYEAPYDAVAAIARHLAFYPDRFEIVAQ